MSLIVGWVGINDEFCAPDSQSDRLSPKDNLTRVVFRDQSRDDRQSSLMDRSVQVPPVRASVESVFVDLNAGVGAVLAGLQARARLRVHGRQGQAHTQHSPARQAAKRASTPTGNQKRALQQRQVRGHEVVVHHLKKNILVLTLSVDIAKLITLELEYVITETITSTPAQAVLQAAHEGEKR